MNTREMATEYRLAQWTQLIQERVAGGESIKDFCQRRGVSRQAYFYWQRKIREAAVEQIVAAGEQKNSHHEIMPDGWARLEAPEDINRKQIGSAGLTIEIGGYKVSVDESTAPELLVKVCRVLKSLC